MKLRIITATRGESPFWPDTLASVAAAAREAEHVVVCPVARMSDVGAAGSPLSIMAETARGLYPSLNQGWRARGEFDAFTWINDDDVLRAPGFSTLVAAMERDPTIDVAFGRVDLIDGRGRRVCDLPIARRVEDLGTLLARGTIPLAQPGTVIRRTLVTRLGGFDERYRMVGDMDFFVRAVAAHARFKFVDAHVASFRLHAGQLSKHETEVAIETARALKWLVGTALRRGAAARFRVANWRAYVERVRKHGWISLRQLYDRTH